MNPPIYQRAARLDDVDDRDALAAAIRDWEPRLELEIPRRDALLYEPDGTLYAICLADTIALRTDRRTVDVHKGDAIVLPQAFAVDAGPVVDLLALRHLGPPPHHFRERFIQVWGFEHLRAPSPKPGSTGRAELIAMADPRHRVPYAVVDVAGLEECPPSSDLQLFVALEGLVTLFLDGPLRVVLQPREVLAALPGTVLRLAGPGRAGVITVLDDLAHNSRIARAGALLENHPSPEYQPPPEW